MSILIKGMDMPKEGGVIVIYKEGNSFYTTKAGEGRRYPLVPVPPHGRLIDGDMLESLIYERVSDLNYKADAFDILRIVQDMRPTIEAEKE